MLFSFALLFSHRLASYGVTAGGEALATSFVSAVEGIVVCGTDKLPIVIAHKVLDEAHSGSGDGRCRRIFQRRRQGLGWVRIYAIRDSTI